MRIRRAFGPYGIPTYSNPRPRSRPPGRTVRLKRPERRSQGALLSAGLLCGKHVWQRPLWRKLSSSEAGRAAMISWAFSTCLLLEGGLSGPCDSRDAESGYLMQSFFHAEKATEGTTSHAPAGLKREESATHIRPERAEFATRLRLIHAESATESYK